MASARLRPAGWFCRQKSLHRNADSKINPGRWETRPEHEGKRPKTPKTHRNSGTLSRPNGFLYQRPYRIRGWLLEAFKNIYLYDHPAGDKEVGGRERRPEDGSHHERKNNAENKILNHFEIKSSTRAAPRRTLAEQTIGPY